MDYAKPPTLSKVLFSCTLLFVVACGGGGGGGGGGESGGTASPAALREVIQFREPESFANGRTHLTARSQLRFSGGVRSELTSDLDCDDSGNFQLRSFAEVRWRNLTNGDAGATPAAVQCFNAGTVFGVGVRSFWASDYIALDVGLNDIEFSTFDGGRQVGRDVVTVSKELRRPSG
jgi:hypothetical protein